MKPRLARHVRLRVDRLSGRPMLLAPERGLALSPTAAAIVELCDGARTRDEIVAALAARYDGADADVIARDVDALLAALRARALLEAP